MNLEILLASAWGPLVIFGMRIVDVSLSTVRVLLAVRGVKMVAPVIGFFEVLLWIFAVGTAINHLDSPLHLIGYAGGFATGTYVGLMIEEKIALGWALVRVVSQHGGVELAEALRERGFGVTELAGQGRDGRVEILYAALRRRDLPAVFEEVDIWDPEAFVTVEQPRSIQGGRLFGRQGK